MPPSGAGGPGGKPPSGNTCDWVGGSAGMIGTADCVGCGAGAGGCASAGQTLVMAKRVHATEMSGRRFRRIHEPARMSSLRLDAHGVDGSFCARANLIATVVTIGRVYRAIWWIFA